MKRGQVVSDKRLLFITSSCLGDAVLTSGILDHLLKSLGPLRVTVACGPVPAPLFEAVPGLETLHLIHKRPYARHWWEVWKHTRTTRWEYVVDLRGTALSFFLSVKGNRWIWTSGGHGHQVERLGRVINASPLPSPRLWTSPLHETEATHLLKSLGQKEHERTPGVIALAPASNWPPKTWPVNHWVALARALTGPQGVLKNASILLVGAPHERPILEAVAKGITTGIAREQQAGYVAPQVKIHAGECHLLTLYSCLSRVSLFVGNDSGLMHLAAAAGAPTVGLFGPTPVDQYRPWGDQTTLAIAPQEQRILRTQALENPHQTAMASLRPDTVLEKITGLLARTPVR